MKNIVGIIQARLGSNRLPGKMLMRLGNDSIISWVIKRLRKSKKIDKLIVATSQKSIDDDLVKEVINNNLDYFRGDEIDVLGRFYKASAKYDANIIVRICADNPFIDHIEVDRLVSFFLKEKCQYAFNHLNKLSNNYADGFGAEIFTRETLEILNNECLDINTREHVSLFIWKNINKFNVKTFQAPESLAYPDLSFDIDELSDFEKLSKLVRGGVNLESKASDIIKIYKNIFL